VSTDGRPALSGGGDRLMKLWDLKTRRVIRQFAGHEKPVWSVAFTPDGKYGVSGGYDKVIKIWNLESGVIVPPRS